MEIRRLDARGRARFHDRIAALESGVTYPLGDDRFELDHGADYFAFFDRLGTATTWVVCDGDRVAGVATGVLRNGPVVPAGAWYGCDLKVHPDYRRTGLPRRLFAAGVAAGQAACGRFYGISMDPPGGRSNPVAKLMGRLPGPAVRPAGQLQLFTADAPTMRALAPVLRAARGPLSYRSLRGVKDVVLQSTGAPMSLLHVQFGPAAEHGHRSPLPGHAHMFCAPAGDLIADTARAMGCEPSATATVLQHGMPTQDWSFILTSDI